MFTTRLWMGTVLVALTAGMLFLDRGLAPFYPFLLAFVLLLSMAACRELLQLLAPKRGPRADLCYLGIAALVLSNWAGQFPFQSDIGETAWSPWMVVALTFAGIVLVTFLMEMADFEHAGGSVERIGIHLFVIAYLGVLPCFFAQIRWVFLPAAFAPPIDWSDRVLHFRFGGILDLESFPQLLDRCTMALALAVFVPKCCDIGAYCTGRWIGKHRMTPVLSPKKTWEGAIGGLVFACVAAIGINRLGPAAALPQNLGIEFAFGLSVGVMGMLGDLAESLIKRDCQQKDAAQTVPGFGGVLDVVDSVIFAAPASYLWFVTITV